MTSVRKLDGPENDGFIERLTVVRQAHYSRVPHINIDDDGFTCGICGRQLLKQHGKWRHE